MISNEDFATVAALDLESIKTKLMHKKSGKGWSLERASAVEREYRRFLYLMKVFPNEAVAPLVDVDKFWHYHILDTMKYAADCQQVFGYFLHHFPYVGMRGKEDEAALERLGERMRTMYEETFGEDYFADAEAGAQKPAMSAGTNLGAAYDSSRPRATNAGPASCTRAISEAAYCVKPVGEAAYCVKPAGEQAWRLKPVLEAAYCVRVAGEDVVDLMESTREPQRNARGEQPSTQARLPEQRAAFYLERPRLSTG